MPKDHSGNSTIYAGMELLVGLARLGGESSLGAIAETGNILPSAAHRHLRALMEMEFVEQDALTARYQWGPSALHLGFATIRKLDPKQCIAPTLQGITDKFRVPAFLAFCGSEGAQVVSCAHGRERTMMLREGSFLPSDTAPGQLYLLYMAEHGREGSSSELRTGINIEALKRDISATGIHAVHEGSNPLASLATPLFNKQGKLAFIVGAVGVPGSLSLAKRGPLARLLLEARARFTETLNIR